MKKILFRKLISDCSIFFLISLFCASIIIWVFQAVNFLDVIIEDGRDYAVYLTYTLLSLPKIVSKIFPFALFFSFSYVLANYELRNELLIFWNYGVTKITLVNFILFFSLLFMTIQIMLTTLLVPKFQNISRELIKSSDTSYFENFLKPRKFIDTISGLTFYVDKIDKNGILKNIYIKKSTGQNKFQTTHAKKGIFKNKNNERVLVLYQGQTLSSSGDDLNIINFSASDFSVMQADTGTTIKVYKLQENYTKELIKCLFVLEKNKDSKDVYKQHNFHNCTLMNYKNIFKELYKRLIIPFYIPLLIIISLIIITKSKENVNFTKFRTLIFIIGLVMMIFSESTQKLIDDNLKINLIIVSLPFVITSFVYILIFYNLRYKVNRA